MTLWGEEIQDLKRCVICKELKPLTEFSKHIAMRDNLDTRCNGCLSEYRREVRRIKKTAPPKPDTCQCCGRPAENDDIYLRRRKVGLVMDHDSQMKVFRGWICTHCNTGIGLLGDSIDGVKMALDYLSRVYDSLEGDDEPI